MYGEPADELAQAATVIQDCLGDHHDAVVGLTRLASFGEKLTSHGRPRSAAYRHFGELMAWHSARVAAALAAFTPAWKHFDRPQTFRPLKVEMKQRAKRA